MAWHNEVGKTGEQMARKYLQKQGYNILEQNYRTKFAEIDLLAKDNNELVFVEVRTKTGEEFGRPEQTVGKQKLRKLKRNIAHFLKYNDYDGPYRIDVIGIILNKSYNQQDLRHFKNVTM